MKAEKKLVPTDSLNPNRYAAAIKHVQEENTGWSPEEPDQSAEMHIVLSAEQFQWLTKQCEFLAVPKQDFIADVLEEWICRNRALSLPGIAPSAMVRWALDEFMQRHRDEFLPI
jgi:hypothetical protein